MAAGQQNTIGGYAMGIVIKFHHARSSMLSRDAKAANVSAVSPAPRARSVESTSVHHRSGMRSRCHHLETVAAVAPVSSAQSSLVGQSSMTERNDVKGMTNCLRQSVLDCKPKIEHDEAIFAGQTVLEMDQVSVTRYRAEFIGRVRAARALRFETQEDAATAMGLKQSKYGKYETRSFLPPWMYQQFCTTCGVRVEWLITGVGAGPKWEAFHPTPKPRQRTRKPRRAA